MFPVIFKISFIEARSYYLLWAFALLIFILWTRKRAAEKYGMDFDKVSSVIMWVYFGAIFGALAGNAAEKVPFILSGGGSFSDILTGGLSSGPGLLCGGLFGIYRLRKLGMEVSLFSDAVSVPTAALIAIGRNGCFLEGCCLGRGGLYASRPWWGIHFPTDPAGFYRYPSQLSEAFAAFLITVTLLWIEKYFLCSYKKYPKCGSVLFPIFLLLFGFYRVFFDYLREPVSGHAFFSGHLLAFVAVALGGAWLYRTYRAAAASSDTHTNTRKTL